ncbi:MAG: GHKL domain-containing protein [Candidatus Omnitrophica bacterium]|nr:GHKL domain-containing protein [Candidatus Omnitrophota bacterium]
MATDFAGAERSSRAEIAALNSRIAREALLVEALNAVPDVVLILNTNRQIVFCNKALFAYAGTRGTTAVLGKRPGEVFGCECAGVGPAGCGTSRFCRECGAVQAILRSQKGRPAVQECRMTTRGKNGARQAVDLRVWASPTAIGKNRFTVFTLRDIQDEKRREVLERTFFHDILNDVSVIRGYAENLRDGLVRAEPKHLDRLCGYAHRVSDAIEIHRDLLAAESGRLAVCRSRFRVAEFLEGIALDMRQSPPARGRSIRVQAGPECGAIRTDPRLLSRALVNLLKNALEASRRGQSVTLGFSREKDAAVFRVSNHGKISPKVSRQIFQRSFSTKGRGRGTGTYSVKLLIEDYLKGAVDFVSTKAGGTEFTVRLTNSA